METTIMGIVEGYIIYGIYWDNGKENGNYYNGDKYRGILYMGFIGIMEKKMETRVQDETAWAFVVWDRDSRCREYGSGCKTSKFRDFRSVSKASG